jgi:hypothetical protein
MSFFLLSLSRGTVYMFPDIVLSILYAAAIPDRNAPIDYYTTAERSDIPVVDA